MILNVTVRSCLLILPSSLNDIIGHSDIIAQCPSIVMITGAQFGPDIILEWHNLVSTVITGWHNSVPASLLTNSNLTRYHY